MNILLIDREYVDKEDNTKVKIFGRRREDVLSFFSRQKSEKLKVGLINGRFGTGTLIKSDEKSVTLFLDLTEDPPPAVNITLILALPRPKALKRILEAVASTGIKKIFIIETWKVEKSYWDTPLLEPEEIKKHLIIGLEQTGCDTILPDVEIRRRFKPFAEDELPLLIRDRIALVAHPYQAYPCPTKIDKPVVLMIGPEGGFIPYEIELLKKIGFIPVTIGRRLLKVETAVTLFLGRFL